MNIAQKIRQAIMALAATIVLVASPVTAQEISPEHLDLARKYVELTDRAAVFEVTVVRTGVEVLRLLTPQNPEIATDIDTAVGDTIKTYIERKGELTDQFARVYAQRLTMEELREIVAFYESEVGQKLSRENFDANNQLQQVLGLFQRNISSEMLSQVRATLKERGFDV